ncbi:hypothetical protein ACWDAO_12420 [Streptomyces sp. NPDC001212]|uniref:hypothetical protein n=1 Tax=Streptomyces sp. HYC2 TaxID=2955207 RepID=UPI0024802045|nr:hypothetical protein [Streptomyces sp. HYC2]
MVRPPQTGAGGGPPQQLAATCLAVHTGTSGKGWRESDWLAQVCGLTPGQHLACWIS